MTLVGLMLLISVSVYVAISWSNARSNLAAELGAARLGGLQTVRSAFEDLPRSVHPHRDLWQLVATFNGNRHVEASVVDRDGKLQLVSAPVLPRRRAPAWFESLLRPDLGTVGVPVPNSSGAELKLVPQPASDIAALWTATLNATGVFTIAAAVGLALLYLVIGRTLAPLADLSRGLGTIGAGPYRQRVHEQGPPELRTLQRGFNAMAERLEEADSLNRALEAQILTIQDEERAEIARDLHDEIGPHLFAVALDADLIGRSLQRGENKLIPDHLRAIQSAVSYMQRQVRDLIARLRPTRAAELGFEAAIGDLVTFWQARQPAVEFVAMLDGADSFVPDRLWDVIYRVVQESVANALRHAETTWLSITVTGSGDTIGVCIANRGRTKAPSSRDPGLGLVSMRERVIAARGSLEIGRENGGWTVTAHFRTSETQMVA